MPARSVRASLRKAIGVTAIADNLEAERIVEPVSGLERPAVEAEADCRDVVEILSDRCADRATAGSEADQPGALADQRDAADADRNS